MRYNPARLVSLTTSLAFVAALSGATLQSAWADSAESMAADSPVSAILAKDRSIAYVMTAKKWAVYQTPDGKSECPQGLNDGSREQFVQLFPENGPQRTYQETAMAREIAAWFPTTEKEPFEFREAAGKTSFGLNLDGKIGPSDFTSPEGEQGVDNQLYRVIGCLTNYRDNGTLNIFINQYMQQHNYNRVVIELTDVDSLANDNDVTVSLYRGLNRLLSDATGDEWIPGGSQRLDMRWGKEFIRHIHGRIVDGVLLTDPIDAILPAQQNTADTTVDRIKGMRLHLALTQQRAHGVVAGYTDVEDFYRQMIRSWNTLILAYGQISSASVYRALHRLADGYPDPVTGKNTAISGAINVEFAQTFIVRDKENRGDQLASAK